jgi:hypothetical protein
VPAERVSMRKTHEVLRLHFDLKLKQRQIACSANLSQSTVHEYLHRFTAAGLSWPLPEQMSEPELEAALFPADPKPARTPARAGMHFDVVWRRIFTSLEFSTKPSRGSYGTLTWRLRKTATSRPRTLKSRRRCSNLSDLSNMHLKCTSGVWKERA